MEVLLEEAGCWWMASVPEGARCPEVGQELVAEAHHKVPDVSSHLRPRDEDAPDDHEQGGVERVADVPQPGKEASYQETHQQQEAHQPAAISYREFGKKSYLQVALGLFLPFLF